MPLVLTDAQVDEALGIIDESIDVALESELAPAKAAAQAR
ncbi:hypothetical protein MPL3356_600001 [Mesorhizobium plurifarium]|uniref:Uncharacterized protein n=1 Tax=Mesorhizobium plurifarium TaxID=69974 RepID=A0A090EB68_MESPL|nr:hypothetical protein MPL3356_490080 [Mesorhizobium plurifarium]CDX27245.1 hypothetical protein MPL3356_600001 [Mesorhizobium plurifarium]